jgi:hypothetical protein
LYISLKKIHITYWIVDNSNDQTAAQTRRNILAVGKLLARDLEAVAAGTGIVVDAFYLIPCHIFNFDLVIISPHIVSKGSWLDAI